MFIQSIIKIYSVFHLLLVPIAAFSGFQQENTKIAHSTFLKSSVIKDSETKSSTSEDREAAVSSLPPVIQEIVDERNEFRINLGRAMDVLKKDYPEILRRSLGTCRTIYLFFRFSFLKNRA